MRTIFAISAITLCLSIIELISHEELESTGAYLIERIQSSRSEESDDFFLMIGAVTSICFFLVSGICYLVGYKDFGLLGIFGSQLGAAFSGILKVAFAHPRPFWKYFNIDALLCSKDFGAPSGHAMSAGASLFVLGYLWMKSGGWRYLKLVIIAIIVIITGYDRMYLGVHFYFQIILGYSFALLIAAIIVYPQTTKLVQRIGNEKLAFIKSQVLWLVLLVLSTIICLFRNSEWDPMWSQNYEKSCGKQFVIEDVLVKNAADSYVFSLLAGLTAGHYLQRNNSATEPTVLVVVFAAFLHLGFINIFLKYLEGFITLSSTDLSGWVFLAIIRYSCGLIYAYFLPLVVSKLFRKNKSLARENPSFSVLTFKIKI
ncbi:unnamed protein product [Blepharisma stoltei]|uniref:Phosphatidic acid phosphatase type 2/haloperoxidase domain-containing protein n=1 Tax=Blepharisma stoltei TaxID=1481888 RepID=A0AAU9ITX7_9CILI|nr:unnamed protein product [Blepharisma stoltei]